MSEYTKKLLLVLHITLKTYTVRLFYNYKNLFGEGICFCLLPFLKKNNQEDSYSISFIKRHLSFFNTNDYLVGFAVGIIMYLESTYKDSPDSIKRFKIILSSTMGAIGDKMVYDYIVPFLSVNFIILSLFWKIHPSNIYFYILLFWIICFNVFNFVIRFYGVWQGMHYGPRSLSIFTGNFYRKIIKIIQRITLYYLVIAITIITYWLIHETEKREILLLVCLFLGIGYKIKSRNLHYVMEIFIFMALISIFITLCCFFNIL